MKKLLALVLAALLCVSVLAACSGNGGQQGGGEQQGSGEQQETTPEETTPEETTPAAEQDTSMTINVAALNGPTGMGMANLNKWSDEGNTAYKYTVTYSSAPDDLTGGLINGGLDIAAVPVNLASVLYNKTGGEVLVCAVNTLGVLYMVTKDETISSMADLEGKTIASAGQGSTPEYVLNYLLEKNGLTDKVSVEYKAEHAECLTSLTEGTADVIMIPEPFVTNAMAKVEGARVCINITQEWNAVADANIVQGVLVVRKAFAQEHPEVVKAFLDEYKRSVDQTNADPAATAAIIEEYGIVAAAAVAEKAIPNCNIVCYTGGEMEHMVSSMLQVLFNANPQSVGGNMPAEDFYLK